jgi:hypothetical protein
VDLIAQIADPALDEAIRYVPGLSKSGLGPWNLVRYPDAFPPARVVSRVREAEGWPQLYSVLSHTDAVDEAWFLTEENVPSLPNPVAKAARVQSWDGRQAVVEHDGSCVLILRRTHYPGWLSRVNNGPEEPVLKVDGGLQGVRLQGSGTSVVSVRYYPSDFTKAIAITAAALSSALLILIAKAMAALTLA